MSLSMYEIGAALKKLRKQNGLTGEDLGGMVGISQSKLSKIETGLYPKLQANEIEKILNILEAPVTIRQQILDTMGENEHRARARFDIFPSGWYQDAYRLEKQSKTFRIFCISVLPMMLQIPSYRQACVTAYGLNAQEMSEDMKLTTKRQDLLWDSSRKFTFIIHQAALYTLIASRSVQVAQLDRLERLVRTSNVKIGIIPVEAGLMTTENGSFAIYDQQAVSQVMAQAEVVSFDQGQVKLLSDVFSDLEKLACYDQGAVDLIRAAADFFS